MHVVPELLDDIKLLALDDVVFNGDLINFTCKVLITVNRYTVKKFVSNTDDAGKGVRNLLGCKSAIAECDLTDSHQCYKKRYISYSGIKIIVDGILYPVLDNRLGFHLESSVAYVLVLNR